METLGPRLYRLGADLATLARAGVILLLLLRVGEGPEALPTVVRLLLLGWTLDVLDGLLARASRRPSPLPPGRGASLGGLCLSGGGGVGPPGARLGLGGL